MASNAINNSSYQNNIDIIQNLHCNDFIYLEKDLEFCDKVSLIFLLYGDTPLKAKIGLQRILILYHDQQSQTTDIITNWIYSHNDSHWRSTIIEALWTIKAKYVLRLLGLDMHDLHERFLSPTNAETNLYIHPILKGIYCICEQMEPSEAKLLVEHVNNSDCGRHQINFTDEKYLEVFLLHWLSELVIEAGEWSFVKSKRNVFCKVDVILEFLHSYRPDLAQLLRRIIIRFNFTSHNVTSVERKKTVTDDDGHDDEVKQNGKVSQLDDQRSFNKLSENGSDDDRYLVQQQTAGYVLIINQIKFYRDAMKRTQLPVKALDQRHGTNKDKDALNRTFSALGYKIVEKDNLTDDEILNEVKAIVTRSGSSDSLIVCILSHGSEGLIYGCNSVPVKIKEIQDIIVSKELLNKPKILIIQSCQGEELQIAEPVVNNLIDSKYLAFDGLPIKTVPMRSDFCVAKSTIPGFSSIRHINDGSWFIQTMCKAIDSESHRKHFLEIMTVVKKQVTELRGDNLECMVPICEETFRKLFYFPPRTMS